VKAARTVLNGGDEETYRKATRLVPTQAGFREQVSLGVGHQTYNHEKTRQDAHHATHCPQPHRVPTDQPRPEEHGAPGYRPCLRTPLGLTAHCWDSQPIVGTHSPLLGLTAHCRCSGPLSVLKLIVGAQAPQSVRRPIVGTHSPLLGLTAHCWDSQPIVGTHSPLSVLRSIVDTPVHCQYSNPTVGAPVHCQYSNPTVGAPVHCRCSSPTVGAPVHCRCPHRKTEGRCPAPRSTRPNKGVQATANSLRFAAAACRA